MAPLTWTVRVSPVTTLATPVMTGAVVLLAKVLTVGTVGALLLKLNSPVVASLVALAAASVTVAVTG